jgi:hypothetical protein
VSCGLIKGRLGWDEREVIERKGSNDQRRGEEYFGKRLHSRGTKWSNRLETCSFEYYKSVGR